MENKTCKNTSEVLNYRNKIIGNVNNITNPAILESIYSFIIGIISMKEKQETD